MADIFVSYTSRDRDWAFWIGRQLEKLGHTPHIHEWEIPAGGDIPAWMGERLQKADRVLCVVSTVYLTKDYSGWEQRSAQWAAADKRPNFMLPVFVEDCDPPVAMAHIKRCPLFGLNEDDASRRLKEYLAEVKPPEGPIHFPGQSEMVAFPGSSFESTPRKPRDLSLAWSVGSPLPPDPQAMQLDEIHEQVPLVPRIWNVPHRTNLNFTGRKDLMDRLRKALCSGDPAALTQAIWGLGGIGKTRLVVEYTYQHARDYALVWWVRAESLVTLASDFATLATKLGLASLGFAEAGTYDQPSVVEAVRRWLERNTGWLLIFDNAGGPDELHDYLPRPAGHTLITSRNRVWHGAAQPFNVPELAPDKAVEFLLKRTGLEDAEAAGALANELGELPLALEHAGAYMEATGCQLSEYLKLFRAERQKLWSRAKAPAGYPATVATTWELAFEKLRDLAPEARDLLNLCAFLAPEDIPRGLLNSGARHLPPSLGQTVEDQFRWDEIMEAVRRYSLLDRIQDVLKVHRLVQMVLYDHLDLDARRSWADVAIRLVDNAFPPDEEEVRSWPMCARLIPHAHAVSSHAETLKVQAAINGRLLSRVGLYLRTRAHFAEAKRALERALVIAEEVHGSGDPEVATIINDLGRVLHDLGECSKAQKAFERALQGHEAAYGTKHPLVARDLNDLGSIILSLGDPKRAIEFFNRAIKIDEAVQGRDHPDLARDRGNLGRALHALGDLPAGREALKQALMINEAHYGPDDPHVAADLSNLGLVLRAEGDMIGARTCFERSLRIREQVLGQEHPSTVRVRDRLGSVLVDQSYELWREVGDGVTG